MAHIHSSKNNRKFDTKTFWKDAFGNKTEMETTLLSALFNVTCVQKVLNNNS